MDCKEPVCANGCAYLDQPLNIGGQVHCLNCLMDSPITDRFKLIHQYMLRPSIPPLYLDNCPKGHPLEVGQVDTEYYIGFNCDIEGCDFAEEQDEAEEYDELSRSGPSLQCDICDYHVCWKCEQEIAAKLKLG
jgi:hypothetical protein